MSSREKLGRNVMRKRSKTNTVLSREADSESHDMLEAGSSVLYVKTPDQSQRKIRSKIRPQVFNFSDESDNEEDQENLPPNFVKNSLKDKRNGSSLSGSLHKGLHTEALHRHLKEENTVESLKSRSTKVQSDISDLEWENLRDISHHPKSPLLSGKKKLFREDAKSLFHSTPKERKVRTSHMNLLLLKNCSQSKCPVSDGNGSSVRSSPTVKNIERQQSFDSSGELESSQGDYVEVKDSSAQTSFQLVTLCEMLREQSDCQKRPITEMNDSGTHCAQGQEDDLLSDVDVNENTRNQKFLLQPDCADKSSNSDLSAGDADGSPRAQNSVSESSGDRSDHVSNSSSSVEARQKSSQSLQSFVEVQDASVQVELVCLTEGSLRGQSIDIVDNDQSETAKISLHEREPLTSLETSQERNSVDIQHSDENGSPMSDPNNSLYVTALEPKTVISEHKSDDYNIQSVDFKTEVSFDTDRSLFTVEDKNALTSVLVANTDSDSSEVDERNDQVEAKIEASYCESSSEVDEKNDQAMVKMKASHCGNSSGSHSEEGIESPRKRKDRPKGKRSSNEGSPGLWSDTVDVSDKNPNNVSSSVGKDDFTGAVESAADTACDGDVDIARSDEPASPSKEDCSVTELSARLQATNISSHRRRKYSDSSDDDDAFENFLLKMKAPVETEDKEHLKGSLGDFIAADDEALSGEDLTGSESSDDEMFYVRTDNIIDSKKRRKSFSPLQEEDSLDERPAAVRSNPTFVLSSDDDNLLDDCTVGAARGDDSSETTKSQVPKSKAASKSSDSFHSADNRVPQTPQLKSCGRARCSDDEDDDDFKTPFITPLRPVKPVQAWERPFETPADDHRRTTKLSDLQGQMNCPMTVSRLSRPSRRSNIGLDDDAVFLKSLSEHYPDYKRHPEALRYIKHFKEKRADLTQRLFGIYNKSIFKEQLPANLQIEWSTLYRKTAGTFCYRRSPEVEAKITLSVKVCDRAERVRDTLAHELCHAAVRLINGVKESHGPVWRAWAQRINRAFPFMPVIARCHDYVIATKYTYKCTKCNYRIGRHSKSLDIDKKVCGHCLGKFEVFLTRDLNNSERGGGGGTPSTPHTPRTPNKFALFVKKGYADVKKKDSSLKHADVMKILSQQFSEKTKISE
ncbi:acidic repeat-containing protein [Plakobranchus ocellatus]|uniref:Acidic repeat-containing protein n=1 Tax=Plakobranchus ocellatus TaxID=259542 RepID=A0AAV4DUJ3_9GAST|nr:acidic repeat-containing protein [Plakobranchus ocellatus]